MNFHSSFPRCDDLKVFIHAKEAVEYLKFLYHQNIQYIQRSFEKFPEEEVKKGYYPFVGISIEQAHLFPDFRFSSYGVLEEPGVYWSTITRPDLFSSYYEEQISLLLNRYQVPIFVGTSQSLIPLPFALWNLPPVTKPIDLQSLKAQFTLPDLSRLDDHIPNCLDTGTKPMALFSAERTDFSLQRLTHYTGTSVEHFQDLILLTNYQRYIDEFIELACTWIQNSCDYDSLVIPGDHVCYSQKDLPKHLKLPQMPSYHLKRKDRLGITFINIGVGPSNAKTITDHLAVLRPQCWIMLGHCAGLRQSQSLGDYVLAHGYVREDHVLDQDVPSWIPIPALAEVQMALQKAIHSFKGNQVRTGTVMTTDNRNWELRSREFYERVKQSRAIAIDMESATVAANGFRFRVPYGTLLCVSDRPIQGDIKLPGMASQFYRDRVNEHLKIGLKTLEILREEGIETLHSRKLRGFDDPPFR